VGGPGAAAPGEGFEADAVALDPAMMETGTQFR